MKDLFSILKQNLGDVAAQVRQIDQELKDKKQMRSDVANLPLPQSDFADMVCEKIELEGAQCSRRMEQTFSYAKTSYVELESLPPILESYGGGSKSGIINPMNIYGLQGEQLKESMHAMVMSWSWPANIGPPRSERKAALEKLDKEIEKLEPKLEELISKANALGVTINLS